VTTTIAPTVGQSPDFLQLGPGASALYGAIDLRRARSAGLQEGAVGTGGGAYKVSLSSGMNLTIAASTVDGVLVQGDSITAQGLYFVPPHSAAIIETVTAAHATLPRLDKVVLEVLDATHDGGGSNLARVRIIAGTATAGTTLDNGNDGAHGAPALPNSAMLLADVLVPAAAASILAGNIRDRRKFAAGASADIVLTSGTMLATASTTMAELSASLSMRMELTGVPVEWRFRCNVVNTGAFTNDVGPWIDGAVFAVANGGGKQLYGPGVAALTGAAMAAHRLKSVSAGSHLVRDRHVLR
jgi:hypothetical protein